MSRLALLIGLRYSRAKHKNRFISFISLSSMIGIMLGVAVLIIGVSAMNGFEQELRQRILAVVPHGELETPDKPFADWQKVVKGVESDTQIIAAAPYIKMTGMLQKGNEMKAVAVKAIDPEKEQSVTQVNEFMPAASWQSLSQVNHEIVIGQGIAKQLGLVVGDKVTLILPNTQNTNKLSAPKRVRLTVIGLFEVGGQLDNNLAFVNLGLAESLTAGVNGVAFKTTDVMDAMAISKRVGYASGERVYIRPWLRSQGNIYQDIQMVKTLMYVILLMVVAVACFNIVSTLVMSVNEKKADIAILQTMGARPSLIRNIFIVQGLLNGVIGAVLGMVIGTLAAVNLTAIFNGVEVLLGRQLLSADVYFINFIPTQVQMSDVTVIACVAILMSLMATLYPAWRASKVQPAQQLGHG